MKKYILVGILSLLFVVSPVSAKADTLQDQYQATLVQLITLLQQQVALLMEQLQALQVSQTALTTQVNQVVQNTTPVLGNVPVPTAAPTPVPVAMQNIYIENGGQGRYWTNGGDIAFKYEFWAFSSESSMTISTGELNQDSTEATQQISSMTKKGLGRYVVLKVYKNGIYPITFTTANAIGIYTINANFCELKEINNC